MRFPKLLNWWETKHVSVCESKEKHGGIDCNCDAIYFKKYAQEAAEHIERLEVVLEGATK